MSNSNRPIQQELKMFSKYKTCKMLSEPPILTKQLYGKKKIVFFRNLNLAPSFPVRPPTGNDNPFWIYLSVNQWFISE